MNQNKTLQDKITSALEHFSNGRIKETLFIIEALIKDYPDESKLFNISGACYVQKGELDTAVKYYEKSIIINPEYAEAHFNLAKALQEKKLFESSIISYKKALKIKPQYAEAHNNLGGVFQELGRLEDASKCYESAILINPNYAAALYSLGKVFQSLGKLKDAVKNLNKVLEIKPNIAPLHNDLGIILNELGQKELAIKHFKKALLIEPNFSEVYNNLGISLQDLNLYEDAIEQYEKALEINPKLVDAHLNLGSIYQDLEKVNQAIEHYNEALSIDPDSAEVYNNLGVIFQELGDVDQALEYYNKALEINPIFADAFFNLGFIYQDLGQVKNSINNYENAISINNHAMAYHNLSYLMDFKSNDQYITQMHTLLSSNKISEGDRIQLCLALARVNGRLENQKDFFKFLDEGNRLRKKELNYSLDESSKKISAIKALFDSKSYSIKTLSSLNQFNIRPIFIVGMPRSGTSLVEQIISNHPDVYGAGELNTLTKLTSPVINNFLSGDITHLTEKALLFIREEYMDMVESLDLSEKVITDKLPLNFQYIGFILSAFPEAKILHIKRDARATCWSNYNYYFSNNENGYSYNLEDLVGFYSLYNDLMHFWHKLYPNQILDICYEDLTTNQEGETRKLLEYCDLDWDENCLNFHENERQVKTPSALQVRRKMYQGSSNAWKKHWAYIQPLINGLKSF